MSKPARLGILSTRLAPIDAPGGGASALAGSPPPITVIGPAWPGTEATSFSIRCHCSYSHIILSICLRHRSAHICAVPTSLLTSLNPQLFVDLLSSFLSLQLSARRIPSRTQQLRLSTTLASYLLKLAHRKGPPSE